MTNITGTYYLDLSPVNDNVLVMRPVYDGWSFKGFEPVKQPIYGSCDLFVGV